MIEKERVNPYFQDQRCSLIQGLKLEVQMSSKPQVTRDLLPISVSQAAAIKLGVKGLLI